MPHCKMQNSSTIKVFKNFKERKSFKPEFGAEGIFGGFMLGVKSISGMAFSFYDWEHLELIRRIEIQPRHVYWSESGNLVCLAIDETYYVLKYNVAVVNRARDTNSNFTEDGIEDAFEAVPERQGAEHSVVFAAAIGAACWHETKIDVDENAVSAIVGASPATRRSNRFSVGSLENQLVTSVSSVSSQNNIVNVIPSHLGNITSSGNSIIGVQKYNTDQISSVIESANFQSSNSGATNVSYNVPGSVQSAISQSLSGNLGNSNEQLKVIYSQTQNLSNPNCVTFPTQCIGNGCIGLTSQNQIVVPQSTNKLITMQPPLVIKQGTTFGQVGMQPGMVTVPMTVNSSMQTSIPNVMTLNKPGGQNVVVTTQNLGSAQPTIIPNVQILNMRPGAPPVGAQKSVATVSPRMVIGTPQVVGARPTKPGITLQTLQTLQPGQPGHLLLKTENGQYQLLRVGPAPAANTLTAPQAQTIRLSTVPAHPGVATVSTSVAAPGQMQQQMPPGPIAAPVIAASGSGTPPPQAPTVTTQKPSDNTKEKCRNFLANLLDLSSKEPKSVERNVRNLIQELIDAQVEPEEFCDRLELLLNASPQPCLIDFLKKSLPLLRQSLVTKELVIEGINPPSPHIAFSTVPIPSQPILSTANVQMQQQQQQKPSNKSGSTIAVLQNIPVHTKINVNKVSTGKSMTVNSKANYTRPSVPSAALSTVLTPGKSLLKEKEKKTAMQYSSQPYVDDKMAGDDDINDVAAMGGVNLAEETQRILGSTELIGTQIRSCKDEYLVPMGIMQSRLRASTARHELEEPSPEVAGLVSHAVHERLKNLIEKLAVIAQHRIDLIIKTDTRYKVTQDVKGQLKFLEELDRVDKKRREDSEREMLLRAAKSRSKNEDPEQAKLKAKAKEMQRAELEELRQREANLTALQAIGPRKKPRLDGPGVAGDSVANGSGHSGSGFSGRSQLALRTRLKRINHRDMVFLLEQERETAHSPMLFRSYLK
ncbi:transcription initiation factor TFIID subunit 4 isoform X2 [Pectinophora gossypiella]|uniref:transcription initiation factor TFIID subunit 4 isoform X2 n=1 Tax=Pectinophora gossypiella TaxID=13191 RepID=UPI00214DFCD8|nr:transcription initiation factor TFIID subunit 4 isoform X2 [Pectinophora gossypiella]